MIKANKTMGETMEYLMSALTPQEQDATRKMLNRLDIIFSVQLHCYYAFLIHPYSNLHFIMKGRLQIECPSDGGRWTDLFPACHFIAGHGIDVQVQQGEGE